MRPVGEVAAFNARLELMRAGDVVDEPGEIGLVFVAVALRAVGPQGVAVRLAGDEVVVPRRREVSALRVGIEIGPVDADGEIPQQVGALDAAGIGRVDLAAVALRCLLYTSDAADE